MLRFPVSRKQYVPDVLRRVPGERAGVTVLEWPAEGRLGELPGTPPGAAYVPLAATPSGLLCGHHREAGGHTLYLNDADLTHPERAWLRTVLEASLIADSPLTLLGAALIALTRPQAQDLAADLAAALGQRCQPVPGAAAFAVHHPDLGLGEAQLSAALRRRLGQVREQGYAVLGRADLCGLHLGRSA